jgi:peptidoglycan-associated lipoprotein
VAAAPARLAPPAEFTPNDNLKAIFFDFDKADIRKGDAEILRASAQWLKDHPSELLLIEGHCDPRGTNEYNLALGERRARAAMNFLTAAGVATSRMSVVSYGEERPVCQEANEACWQKDRRAFFLTKPQ